MTDAHSADTPDALYSPMRAAQYLDAKEKFLELRRRNGTGPSFIKMGRLVRYRRSDLDKWLAEHRVSSTAEGRRFMP